MLQHRLEEDRTPAWLARELEYTVMTVTRAFKEINAISSQDLCSKKRGWLPRFKEGPKVVWEKYIGFMRSPVKRRLFAHYPDGVKGIQAGLTALAYYTSLSSPPIPVYAVSWEEWTQIKRSKGFNEIPVLEPNCVELEIWHYSPHLNIDGPRIVDRLSLFLSLKDDPDERVQSSLEKMLEDIKW